MQSFHTSFSCLCHPLLFAILCSFCPYLQNLLLFPCFIDDLVTFHDILWYSVSLSMSSSTFYAFLLLTDTSCTFYCVPSLSPWISWQVACYDRTSWTIIFHSLLPFASWLLSFTSCNSLELDYLLISRLGQDALWTVPLLLPLSITCFTLAATVPFTHASVPADARPLCTLYTRISSLLPYVSWHHWCTLSASFTCVLPRPLCLPQ